MLHRVVEKPALLVDSDGLAFVYRTTVVPWLHDAGDSFHCVVSALLDSTLSSEVAAATHACGIRGPHLPCIMGHHRQHQKVVSCSPHLISF